MDNGSSRSSITHALSACSFPPSVLFQHGLQGQEFDFTGEASKIYSLISDESLEVNALFGTAYATALTVDPETLIAGRARSEPRQRELIELG